VARRLEDHPVKLDTLAVRYGVSRERIRQIEMRAFEKIQQVVLERRPNAALPEQAVVGAPEIVRTPVAGVSVSLAA